MAESQDMKSEKAAAEPSDKANSDLSQHEDFSTGPLNHDPPLFEDYLYFAAIQRRLEASDGAEHLAEPAEVKRNWLTNLSEHKGRNVNVDVRGADDREMTTQESERANAARALRLASWASVFYLITTDILGPFNAPFAISQVGWAPGECFIRTAYF